MEGRGLRDARWGWAWPGVDPGFGAGGTPRTSPPPHLSTRRLEATLRTTEGCLSWGFLKNPTQAGLPRKEEP